MNDMGKNNCSSSIKILVAYHKPSRLLANSIMTPIHAGRASSSSYHEHPEFFQSMAGDDTGDNISHLNPYYSEMTAVYWAWKNYEQLGNPNYFGLAHYRRLLGFGHDQSEGYIVIPDFESLPASDYAETVIAPIVTSHDICIRTPIKITQSIFDEHKNEVVTKAVDPILQYTCAHDIKHLELTLALLVQKHPEYRSAVNTFIDMKRHYMCNLFVMRKNLFFEYAEWIFPILNTVHAAIDYSSLSPYQQRVIGFLAERLTGIFVLRKMEQKSISIKHVIGLDIDVNQNVFCMNL